MKKINILGIILLIGISFSYPSVGSDSDQNCGRLKSGDNFNRINEILDCIESKTNTHFSVKTENAVVYSEEKEPNDSIENANMISLGSAIKASINRDDDPVDIFTFIAPESGSDMRIILRQPYDSGFAPYVVLYDSNEELISQERGRINRTLSFQLKTKPKEQYYMVIKCAGGCRENIFYKLLLKKE